MKERIGEDTISESGSGVVDREPVTGWALSITWCRERPDRMGELCYFDASAHGAVAVGRGEGVAAFLRDRPGERLSTGPLACPQISRRQLQVVAFADRLHVENVGKACLAVNGSEVRSATVQVGDVLEIGKVLQLVVTRHPRRQSGRGDEDFPFGMPDADGFVGESPIAWALRDSVDRVAETEDHVLILGQSGTGKELVARRLHRRTFSARLVARSAATLPETLVDAELFGNARNYPNPGTPERPGLIGEADGGMLFLDEIGELPVSAQSHLLRVMDAGQYHRLGESRARRARLRIVGATNRPVAHLKHDVAARFSRRIDVEPLRERRADVPLIARSLLGPKQRPGRHLSAALLRHSLAANVRDLRRFLALARDDGSGFLELTSSLEAALRESGSSQPPGLDDTTAPAYSAESRRVIHGTLTHEEVQIALDRHGGSIERAYRDLGLSSRHVLARLIRKHRLVIRRSSG